MANTLIVPASGVISFSNDNAGSSSIPNLFSASQIQYDGAGGLVVSSLAQAASALTRFSVAGNRGTLLTVTDTLTATLSVRGIIHADGGNSNQWNSNYTTTSINSANWSGAYTSFNANSSFYDAAVNELFTYVISETGNEFITEDSLLMVDSNIEGYPAWNSTTDTVVGLSAGWQNAANAVASNASNWTSTYTTVCANSASWSSAYTTTNTNSASWSSAYTTTNTNSATWNNWSTVSGNYALGSQYVKLSGDTMTGSLTINSTTNPALIVGNGNTGFIKIGDGTFSKTAGSGWILDNLRVSGGNYQNGITFQTGGTNAGLWSAGTGILSFSNNITESMRLDASGNLGIGTTAPAARLTVFGNISASGTLSANSINSNAYVANTGFVIADTGTSRVFTNTDNGKCITFSNTTPITASLPAGLPVGFNVMLIQINTGQVYLSAGAGVTINSDGGKRNIASQHSAASLISYAANTFNLAGNLST